MQIPGSGERTFDALHRSRRRARYSRRLRKQQLERGTNLGRYIVLDLLGRGGMGTVYAAYDPELDRKVALKLLDTGTKRSRRERLQNRLRREAQALARLNHPNVVTIYDVHDYEDHLFLAMEYVEGRTLDDWLAVAPRSQPEILDVFQQAGRGLEAAHRAGLVHRDFKPSNLMVTDEGRALILDFGLARRDMLESEDTEVISVGELQDLSSEVESSNPFDTSLTHTGAFLGTPAYMAPEQHEGEPAGTAADQFSFCLTLYEALYGESPFSGSAPIPLRFKIAEPPVNSRVPARLRRIILRGLAVDPADRHPSIKALLAKLSRDPWESRRRWLSAALLGLLAVAAFLVYQSRRDQLCRGAEDQLAGVWTEDHRRVIDEIFAGFDEIYAADVLAATRTTLDRFAAGWTEMHTDTCEATHLRGEQSLELLDLRMSCLAQRRQELAAVVGLLAGGEDLLLENVLQTTHALTPLSVCADTLALTAPMRPPEDPEILAWVEDLRAQVATAQAYRKAGNSTRGHEIANATTAAASEIGYWPLTAEAMYQLGVIKSIRGETEEAVETLQQALLAAVAGGHERVAAEILLRFVWVKAYSQPDFEAALRYADQAAAILERLSSPRDLEWRLANRVGLIRFQQGKYNEALANHQQALRLQEASSGANPLGVIDTLIHLGNAHEARGVPAEALQGFERALHLTRSILGDSHPRLVLIFERLGRAYYSLGRFGEARKSHERALALAERVMEPQSEPIIANRMLLGNVDLEEGRLEEALLNYRLALESLESLWGKEHPYAGLVNTNIALALARSGELDQALQILRQVLVQQEALYGPDSSWIAGTTFILGETLQDLGRQGEAWPHFERALEIWEDDLDPDALQVAQVLTRMGKALIAQTRPAEAVALLERAVGICHESPHEHKAMAEAQFALAQALSESGESSPRVRRLARQALDSLHKTTRVDEGLAAEMEAWLAAH